jgi:hypothetical protein
MYAAGLGSPAETAACHLVLNKQEACSGTQCVVQCLRKQLGGSVAAVSLFASVADTSFVLGVLSGSLQSPGSFHHCPCTQLSTLGTG